MTVRLLARLVYTLAAVVFLAAGGAVLLLGAGVVPANLSRRIIEIAGGDGPGVHLLQEMSTLFVLAGLVCLWCARHYERSLYFHWALTTFWGLFALVHWFDHHGRFEAGMGQVIVTLPLLVFVALGVARTVRR